MIHLFISKKLLQERLNIILFSTEFKCYKQISVLLPIKYYGCKLLFALFADGSLVKR